MFGQPTIVPLDVGAVPCQSAGPRAKRVGAFCSTQGAVKCKGVIGGEGREVGGGGRGGLSF